MENLDQILSRKRREARRLEGLSVANVTPSLHDLGQYLGTGREDLSVIADLQRIDRFQRHPRRADLDLVRVARRLDDAEVDAVGVGTDPDLWGATLQDLTAIEKDRPGLPVLRRDVILTAEDVYLSRLAGADGIVLMPTIIDDRTLHELAERAQRTRMAAVAQCWDETCVAKALDAEIRVIEITAWGPDGEDRNIGRIERLAARVPRHVTVVASGDLTLEEALRLRGQVDAVSLGEPLLAAENPGEIIERLKESP